MGTRRPIRSGPNRRRLHPKPLRSSIWRHNCSALSHLRALVQADYRPRIDNRQGIRSARHQAIRPTRELPVRVGKDQPFRSFSAQNI